jgi:tRNA threonylcarbamoyladenosine biosynthesis protein TsaE
MNSVETLCENLDATQTLARQVGAILRPGDVVLLKGDMAAGKTRFVHFLADACGTLDRVSSPTYTIAHLYRTPGPHILHIDAYRLSGYGEFLDLGLEEEMPDAITLIEWPERLGLEKVGNVFKEALTISICRHEGLENGRKMTLSAQVAQWDDFLETCRG